ncbi:phage major capsid protein [Isoptericola sp. NPDC019693]|uniref:phage major capsid protein n=1 Tax=Isoptericola sp. NPDC019693 TaxID=3364009 RepID=UPI0037B7D59E
MTMFTTSTDVSGILPDDYGPLIVQPVQRGSIAYQVSTNLGTTSTKMHVPIVTDDPSAAWVAEGAEITPDDGTLDELTITPTKIAGLTAITRELASDSSPAAAEIVGSGLARSIATRVDQAFFGAQSAPAQSGLGALSGVATVDAGSAWANLDPFLEAISNTETVGTNVTSFVANPADALLLAQLKDQTGSNRPLLGSDPTQPTRRLIHGVPLYVSPAVTAGTVWGIPRDRVLVVTREDVTLEVDKSVFFTSDRVAVKAIMRVGFGFPHAAAVQKITLGA